MATEEDSGLNVTRMVRDGPSSSLLGGCKIIRPTQKSNFEQIVFDSKNSFKKNYLLFTSKLNAVVNENKFQHFIFFLA